MTIRFALLGVLGVLAAPALALDSTAPMSKAAFVLPEDADLENIPCRDALGLKAAKALVAMCLDISSATHPPCNVQNACQLMVDEIKRGCAASGSSAPEYCADFEGD